MAERTQKTVTEEDRLGWPQWIVDLFGASQFNMMEVDEFLPGQGRAAACDSASAFGQVIHVYTLGGPLIMHMVNCFDPQEAPGKEYALLLEPGSRLALTGPARYYWSTRIDKNPAYQWKGKTYKRARTVQLWLRHVLDEFHQIDDELVRDMKAEGGTVGDIKTRGA